MRVTVADLFAAYCRANVEYTCILALTEEDFSAAHERKAELSEIISIISHVLENSRHEMELFSQDLCLIKRFFSKTSATA